jgi:cellulose synthase operon protein C
MSCEEIGLVHALADGELAPDAAAATRAHVAGCAECAAELAELMQLEAIAVPVARREADKVVPLRGKHASVRGASEGQSALASGDTGGLEVRDAGDVRRADEARAVDDIRDLRGVPRRSARSTLGRAAVVAGAAFAIAAGVAVYALPHTRALRGGASGASETESASQVAMSLPPQRGWEARLSWSGAAAHRPYQVARSAERTLSSIPLGALAALERRGDMQGVGVLAMLNGDHRQAQAFLERAPAGPGVLADRAAVALAEGDAERALELADRALAAAPAHPAATWNRALALRELGLVRAAAAAFQRIALGGEPGWSAEAAGRAAALEADAADRSGLTDRVLAAGPQLAQHPEALSLEDARRLPGLSRLFVYDALRAASPAQHAALRPLVAAVEATSAATAEGGASRAGEGGAVSAFARRTAALAGAHPGLAATYAELLANRPPTGQARQAYLSALRAAGAEELLIGALVRLSPGGRVVAEAELPELMKRTNASPDPWMKLLGAEQRAQVALAAERLPEAEAILLRARTRCQSGGDAAPAFRCIKLGLLLGEVYGRWQRVPEARAELLRTWKLARAEREWLSERQLLEALASLTVISDDATGGQLPLARAYAEELVLRQPGQCTAAVWAHTLLAMTLLNQLRVADARRELAAAPACDQPMTYALQVQRIFVRVHVLRDASMAASTASMTSSMTSSTAAERAAMRAEIARLRAEPALPPAQRAMLDHCEGRLLIDADHAAGSALLRQAISSARQLATVDAVAVRAAAFSTSVLALAEARRGDGAAALAALADEQGVPLPSRCALGLAVEDQRRLAIARGAAGEWVVHYDEQRTSTADDPRTLVPADLIAALRDCPVIDVLARPPLHGKARLLPDELAWRYRSARREPLPAPPAPPSSSRSAELPPSLIVADVEPPASLGLPRLATWQQPSPGAAAVAVVSGASATPARVLASLPDAGELVIHAHGIGSGGLGGSLGAGLADAAFLALSADAAGNYALTAAAVRALTLRHHPLVVLAACSASQGAPVLHQPWSLPAAFVHAGARAVLASSAPIPDLEAGEFLDGVRAAIAAGSSAAIALRDARVRWLAAGRADWVRDLLVFE